MTVTITIDQQTVSAKAGATLWDVCVDHGIYIPSLCYIRDRPCLGTCRVCAVKVNGRVVAACSVSVAEGMQVEVNEAEVTEMRKMLVESLFIEGNHNCPSCEKSGRCDLQAVAYEVDMMVSRFPYRFPLNPRETAAKNIWLERDRCIFCQRCVEFIRDKKTKQKIFSISHRGGQAQIDIDVTLADLMPPEQITEAADICPVGCIIEKGVGYNHPIGDRKYDIASLRERILNGETQAHHYQNQHKQDSQP